MIEFDRKKGANPVLALASLLEAVPLIKHAELRRFIIVPIVINFLLYAGLLLLGYLYVGHLIQYFIPEWLSWLSGVIYPVFFMCFFMLGLFSFTMVAHLIAAPFYADLSAKTAALFETEPANIQEPGLLLVWRSEAKRLIYVLSCSIPLFILSFIPLLNFLSPILWGVFTVWGVAMEYFAYPLENAGLLFKEQRTLLKTIRIGALTFGALVLCALMLPIINILVPPIAVIASTLYQLKLRNKTSINGVSTYDG